MRDVMKRRTGFDMLKLSRWDIVGINVQWEGSIISVVNQAATRLRIAIPYSIHSVKSLTTEGHHC
jgi:hypothetical protein